MLRARRAFLEAEHYRPLLIELQRRVRIGGAPPIEESAHLLDVGCGEGYFTASLAEASSRSETWGIDISRAAIDMAARRHPEVRFAVAAVRDLPVTDGVVDLLVSSFAPRDFGEFSRVLKPGGRLILIGPGAAHLLELRRKLYRDVRLPGRRTLEQFGAGWSLNQQFEVRHVIELSRDDRQNLLAMTPYAWAGDEESRLAVMHLPQVTAHFVISEYTKDVA